MAKKEKEDDDGPLPAETLARLERLARLIRQASRGEGLIPVQWEALRYLSRANRFSNSPGALARYLGATKGTISQTVGRLEKKGLLSKFQRTGDVRSIALVLTEKARGLLKNDPLQAMAKDFDDLGGKTQRRLARGVSELLSLEVMRQKQPLFGTCPDCRFFREGGSGASDTCMIDQAVLSASEKTNLCIEHVPH